MDYIHPMDQKRNCLRWREGESFQHVFMKLQVAYWLMKQGWSFYSEAKFSSPYSGRADLVAFSGDKIRIIEVMETEEVLMPTKVANYPPWEIIKIRAYHQFDSSLMG